MCRSHLFSLSWIIADFYRKLSSPIKPGPGPAYNAIKSFLSILLKQNNKKLSLKNWNVCFGISIYHSDDIKLKLVPYESLHEGCLTGDLKIRELKF